MIYIVVCCGSDKHNGKPVAATFGAFTTQAEAKAVIEANRGQKFNLFTDDAEWTIRIDELYPQENMCF